MTFFTIVIKRGKKSTDDSVHKKESERLTGKLKDENVQRTSTSNVLNNPTNRERTNIQYLEMFKSYRCGAEIYNV